MNGHDTRLRRELRLAGADASEIDELTSVAMRLRLLKPAAKTRGKVWPGALKPALMASSGLLLGVIVVMLAQSAAPTSWLYPVQKLSDAVAVKAHPGYRGTVMMRRAQQVNELVADHASPKVIMSTLDSYDAEAAGYKAMSGADYAAFDYCKTNLQQAAAAAPHSVRSAIDTSLESLNTT